MERSEVSFESQIPYPGDQTENTDPAFENQQRQPSHGPESSPATAAAAVQPAQVRPDQQFQPYLRQFHSLPPNIRNPNEPLPIATHLDQLEHISQLHLHQGSVCQFPQKVRKTGEKLPDQQLHIGETEVERLANLHLHQGSVCQFPTKMRNPEDKLPDHSHLPEYEQLKNLHLHQGSVCQFPTKVRNPEEKFADGPHIQEMNLHLKQGSVVQFPANINLSKDDYFHPPEDPLKESLPLAHVPHPDHCLPSAARQQQTYITHPNHGPSKLIVRGVSQSPRGSPDRSRGHSPGQWPPGPPQQPRKQYHAEGGPKTFVWPPTKPQFHRSFQELPAASAGGNPEWNPSANNQMNNAFAGFAPQRRQYNWPPNRSDRRSSKLSSQHQERYRSMLELDEVCVIQSPGTVASYRPPPWSQFYKPAYYAES